MKNSDSSMPRAPRRRRFAALAVALGVVVAVSAVPTPASAAPRVSTLAVGAQSGTPTAGTTGSTSFLVTVTNGNFLPVTANLSVSGLPAGATGSFSPSSVSWGLFTPAGTARTSTLTVSTTAAVPAGATSFTVTAARNTSPGDNASGGGTLTIAAGGQQAQTIGFAAIAGRTYGDADFNVGATSTSGLPVTFAATGSCTVVGSLVHLTGAGSCTVTASQAGNASYLPAPDVPRTFAIAQASQTIDFPPVGPMLTSGSFTPAATATSGLTVSFAASGSCSLVGGVVELAATPGSCTVAAVQAGNANYAAAPGVARTFAVIAPGGQIDLYAVEGSTTLPGASGPLPVYGYSLDGSAVDRPGGPVLDVTAGDDVTIVLHNELDEATSLVVRGQSMVADQAGAPPGGTAVYTFTAGDPGTVIYEAGPLEGGQYQSAMGLYGALRVLPQSGSTPDAVVLVSELDPALNGAAAPAAFDMRSYAPTYELINGSTYADTAELGSVDVGDSLLLRYVNAGTNYHSMGVLGAEQRIVADDGHPLDEPFTVVAQTVGPGQTVDAIVDVSAQAVVGTRLAVYDAALQLNGPGRRPASATASLSYGGALGFVEVTGTAAGGPLAIDLDVTATQVTATIDDGRTGDQNIQAAEFYVDSVDGTGTAMSASDGSFNSSVEAVQAARPSLSNGLHTIYVRGRDALGNWGPYSSYVVAAVVGPDATGPVVSAIAMAPNPANGTASVALQASASDATTGGANVTIAEYMIDGGTAVALTVSPIAITASLDGTIPAGVVASLSNGTHVVDVRAQDSAGNWGDPVSANLVVDTVAPTVSGVTAAPNPSNGLIGVNTATPAVRISTTANDATSSLSAAEGFIDTVGTNGTGFVFAPTDGTWNSSTETIISDIPLATIRALSNGGHTIYVHAKDAAGNWGSTSTLVLTVDKTVPTASIALAGPTPTSAASVGFTVTFSESVTGGAAGDFTLVQGGGLSGSTISSVTGSGTTRTVTVAVGSGSGTLGLDLAAASSFSDAAGNAPTAVTGPQYTIAGGAAPPAVAGITPASTNPAGVTTLAFTVTFSQPVTGGSAANFTLVPSGISGASIASVSGTGTTRTVTVNTGTGAGTLRIDLTSSAGITSSGGSALVGLPFVGTPWSAPPLVYFSTAGNTNPQGVGGTADDADVYLWNPGVSPRAFSRSIDMTAITNPLPAGANVDAFDRLDATHFLVSFADAVAVPGAGTVQDEDIVYYNAGTWSLVFDGSANGIAGTDIDAISTAGNMLYFSTDNNDNLPGVTGAGGDDADIYRYNSPGSFTRIIDASALGWSTDNVDGLTFVDATHMYLSYGVDTTVSGLGAVADEDVVYGNGTTWSMYFDGSVVGMTDPNVDVDALDLS